MTSSFITPGSGVSSMCYLIRLVCCDIIVPFPGHIDLYFPKDDISSGI